MKKVFLEIAVIAIVVVAAWNVNYGSQIKGKSDLLLASIEALARSEDPIDGGELPEVVISCSYHSCAGIQCHKNNGVLSCPCRFTGSMSDNCY